MTEKGITLEQFKARFDRRGYSVMDLAFNAQKITDDAELAQLAKDLITAEDKFADELDRRNIGL